MKINLKQELRRGLIKENAVFVLLLGMCPTLAVTGSAINGLGMGLASTAVLLGANIVISLIKNLIPDKVRIPAFIVVIASFVTVIDLTMNAYTPDLHEQLGIFIPLIVVNCLILGRAEAFASKKGLLQSIVDGLVMGMGFTFALTLLGSIREILGAGSIFGVKFVSADASTILLFILPPGAFIALGFLIAAVNKITRKKA
jgi:electron transport complex protein RnfE